jgi:hypothetical protein
MPGKPFQSKLSPHEDEIFVHPPITIPMERRGDYIDIL